MNSLDQAINLKVQVTTLIDETITGTIYAFSPKQHVIALKTPELYRIINSSFIKTLTLTGPVPKRFHKSHESFKGKPVDIRKLEARLKNAVERGGVENHTKSVAASKKPEPSALALKIHGKLVNKFGKENVHLQGNDSMLLFKEVVVGKPYALNKISNGKKTQSSKHLEEVKTALREMWLLGNNTKQGG
ncbi:hypothetical protein PUMCH_003699 [Australozyma saopauloensis]|uniref:AD domain-containing protein n=1 Tax=Australozyma saopauloensis TaxID=291208 RepID=A0AAX4HCL9_9ASCO|nr:hypothetical protein PUMCH_003699 [[Candida] saopauloensis]